MLFRYLTKDWYVKILIIEKYNQNLTFRVSFQVLVLDINDITLQMAKYVRNYKALLLFSQSKQKQPNINIYV